MDDTTQQTKFQLVDATPVKSFFVSMLTRDIKLEEAILDLLDNCVDGILRTGANIGPKPYSGFKAEIEFSKNSFCISDNCKGIPWNLHEYAFRMGRPPDRPPEKSGSVGVYGIGMKRAIFKMGKQCLISTRNGDDQYEIEITPEWIDNESSWKIPVQGATSLSQIQDGTTIVIGNLYQGIAKTFGEGAEDFRSELENMVSTHYAYIIDKGFEVKINGDLVKPRTTKIVFDSQSAPMEKAIRPFIFKGHIDGVDVFLTVGFTSPIPSESEIQEEQEGTSYSSAEAGWTILCNDRAVLHCDRTELTGWGEAGVPRYHTQFIAISGIVEFNSKDPSKLPTTTTKRGIDASSPLFLQIKNKMREGMSIFTNYTNKWKGRADESMKQIKMGESLSLIELKDKTKNLQLNPTRKSMLQGDQYKPRLAQPNRVDPTNRSIAFSREITKIRTVAEYFGDSNMRASEVGENCFDTIYEEAQI